MIIPFVTTSEGIPAAMPIRFNARFLVAPAEAASGALRGSGELEELLRNRPVPIVARLNRGEARSGRRGHPIRGERPLALTLVEGVGDGELAAHAAFLAADWAAPLAARFDLVVSNPPWIPGAAASPLERAIFDPGGGFLARGDASVALHGRVSNVITC